MMNAFYFILQALFVLKIVFDSDLTCWLYRNKGLIRKIRLI